MVLGYRICKNLKSYSAFAVRATSFPAVNAQGLSLLGLQQTNCSLIPCDGAYGYPPQNLGFLAFSPSPLIGPFRAIPRPSWGRAPGLPTKRRWTGDLRASAQPVLGQNPSLLGSKRSRPETSIFPVCLVVQFGVFFQTRVLRTGPHLAGVFSCPWASAQIPDLCVAKGRPALLPPAVLRRAQGRKRTQSDWVGKSSKFPSVQFGLGE